MLRNSLLSFLFSLHTIISASAQTGSEWEAQRLIWRCQHSANEQKLQGAAEERFLERCYGVKPKIPEPRQRAEASANGVWTYSRHPVLGLSAHVNVGNEALGIVCEPQRPDAGWNLSLRLTAGLVPTPENLWGSILLFDHGKELSGGNLSGVWEGRVLVNRDNACGLGLKYFRSARDAKMIKTDSFGITMAKNIATYSLKQGGKNYEVTTPQELDQLDVFRRIPMTGSGTAIRALISACPRVQYELKYEMCGDE